MLARLSFVVALVSVVATFAPVPPPPPPDVAVNWNSSTHAALTWTQYYPVGGDGLICVGKTRSDSPDHPLILTCEQAALGPHRIILPPLDSSPAAYWPRAGDRYWLYWSTVRFGPIPLLSAIYLPLIRR